MTNPYQSLFEAAGDTADAPFSGPYSYKSGSVKDKSGAVHTQKSRVKHLSQLALKHVQQSLANRKDKIATEQVDYKIHAPGHSEAPEVEKNAMTVRGAKRIYSSMRKRWRY